MRRQGNRKMFEEIISENVPNVLKNTNLYIQEDEQTPSRLNTRRSTNRHVLIKILTLKEKVKILKAAK